MADRAQFIEGDMFQADISRATVLALNPTYAEFYNNAAEMSVQHRLYTHAVDMAKEAVRVDPLREFMSQSDAAPG